MEQHGSLHSDTHESIKYIQEHSLNIHGAVCSFVCVYVCMCVRVCVCESPPMLLPELRVVRKKTRKESRREREKKQQRSVISHSWLISLVGCTRTHARTHSAEVLILLGLLVPLCVCLSKFWIQAD